MRCYPILLLAVGLPLWACDDPTGSPTGTLVVSINTEGEDPDLDGYRLTVDDADTLDIEPTGTAQLELAAGRHTLRLLDVAVQCSVAPGSTVELEVSGGRRTGAAFEVSCPATRARVTVETSGLQPDSDGYRLAIDGIDSVALSPTATVEVELPPGRHTLRLLDVSEKCSVVPGTEVEVDIPAGNTVPVAFEVTCSTGASITVRTTGLDFDSDGYRLVVDDSDVGDIGINFDDPRLIGLDPGSHTIGLTDLTPNCAFDGPGSRTVTIVAAEVVPVEFEVVCTATSGVIAVVISGGPTTTLQVTMDGVTRFSIGPSGRGYLTGVPAGDHVVSLGEAANCSNQTGAQTVTVTAGTLVRDTVEVAFSVTCVSGFLITVPTIGPIPRTRYRVYVGVERYYCDLPIVASGDVAPNDSLVLQVLDSDTYCVFLSNLPRNCRVTEQDPPDPIRFERGDFIRVEVKVACS